MKNSLQDVYNNGLFVCLAVNICRYQMITGMRDSSGGGYIGAIIRVDLPKLLQIS